MLPNPYAPGELPRVLAGREQQQDRIKGYLSRIGTYGEMGGPLLVFLGPRGVGKTSLLREAQRDAEAHGFITGWVACRRNAPFLPDLVSRVGKAIETADILPRAEKGTWKLRLESIALEFGLPSGVKVSATAAADRSGAEAPPRGAQISALEDLLHETSAQIRARGGAGLVVFVDELHAATRDDLAVLLNAMQNLAGRREDNPLAIIGAGLPSTPGVLVNAATFGERSTFLTLPRLEPAAAVAAVAEPASELGVTWTPAALQAIAAEAQGFPYLLQVLAHATWEVAKPSGTSDVLDVDQVRAGLPLADDQLTSMYAARWAAATELEKQIMSVMAQAGTPTVTRAEIAAALGRPTQALGVPRERLIDKGIIEPASRGEVRFTMPGFDRYIREILATGAPSAADPAAGSLGAGRRRRELPLASDGGHDAPRR
ncbi:ATP-binding protein [Nocardioides sp. SOB77]|uniref:ATP-binding protein n=1 Tax=Nocardioides oceani TaxID=3058369 RepID=A0ABT8FKQ1_9ACTN|nr:ATP-binding protein [Nocardioides oceani]MDN4175263.1 ATP-binding protein [Nocardioides oceani]